MLISVLTPRCHRLESKKVRACTFSIETILEKKNERILLKIACTKFLMLSEYKENFIIVSGQNIIDKSF